MEVWALEAFYILKMALALWKKTHYRKVVDKKYGSGVLCIGMSSALDLSKIGNWRC